MGRADRRANRGARHRRHLLAVSTELWNVGFAGGLDPADDAARTLADSLAAAFGDTPPDGLEGCVREGHAAQVLIEFSADTDMLVVGSRGHGGFAGLLLGSVSAYCTEHGKCPVVVVPHVLG